MSNQPQSAKSIFGSWAGTEERPSLCDNTHIVEGFNVDFVDGTIQRRKGSVQLMNPTTFRPTQIFYSTDGTATNFTELSRTLTDGDLTTAIITSAFSTTGSQLWIGSPNKFGGIRFTLTSPSSTAAVTMTIVSYDVAANTISQTIVDGTAVGGSTLHQTGNVTWTSAQFGAWYAGGATTFISGPAIANLPLFNMYWVKVTVSANITGCNISEIAGIWMTTDNIDPLNESMGMTEFVTTDGDRLLVSSSTFPSRYVDSQQAFTPDPKVVAYDLARGDTIPVVTSMGGRSNDAYAARTNYVTFNGWLLGNTSSGILWKFNGKTSGALEALPGNDYLNNVVGAQGYLATAPRGQFLEVYHSKLMVAGNPTTPLTFFASLPDNDIINIPAGATVGGPNVWPVNSFYSIPGRQGDYITGTAVVNDRYVIFTRYQTWVFDESSLRLANGDVGCIAPGSVQRIDQNVFFLSDSGVFMHDSVNAIPISGPIERTLRERVNWKAAPLTAHSAHHKDKGEYWLWVPINGEWQAQLILVFNYLKQYWRIVGAWYPFDTDSRRNTLATSQTFTAATSSLASNGKRALVCIATDGTLWQHDVGYDDNGIIYPAYAILNRASSYSRFLAMAASDSGEDYVSAREWYMTVGMDGSWIECFALRDGERFDQELDRRFANVATNSEVVQKQALVQNAVSANVTEQTFATVASWPVTPNFAQFKKLKFSFGGHITKLQPVIHWAGGQFASGLYLTNQVAAAGPIYDIQIDLKPLGTGR